jgi:hypothetical protein|tara:strand:- start:11505 stop:11750 length:246 start_codon:yes stop_codon:yes gene_type:complete
VSDLTLEDIEKLSDQYLEKDMAKGLEDLRPHNATMALIFEEDTGKLRVLIGTPAGEMILDWEYVKNTVLTWNERLQETETK